jgi:hypothetical protein
MMRSTEGWIGSHGRHSEPLLQMYSFSYKSQLNISGHMLRFCSCFGMWNSCPKFVRSFQLRSV